MCHPTALRHSPVVDFYASYPHTSPENWATSFFRLSLKEEKGISDQISAGCQEHYTTTCGTTCPGNEKETFKYYLFIYDYFIADLHLLASSAVKTWPCFQG